MPPAAHSAYVTLTIEAPAPWQTGIAECDRYGVEIQHLSSLQDLPAQLDIMFNRYESTIKRIGGSPASARAEFETTCRVGADGAAETFASYRN